MSSPIPTIPSQQDFENTQDLTNAANVTGAQLNGILTTGTPFEDKGIIAWTTDMGGIPNVPDAITYPKWQTYLWGRIQPPVPSNNNTPAVTFYFWNVNAGSIAIYGKWQPLFSGSIGLGSIVGNMIAALTITDANIANVSASKIVGSIAPTGAAGGSLSGTYPNPLIAALAISGSMLGQTDGQGISDANLNSIATGGGLNPIGANGKLQVPLASPYFTLGVNSVSTQLTWIKDFFAILSAGTGLGLAGSIPIVNPGQTALVWQALGAALSLPYVNGANALAFLPVGTANQVLAINAAATGYQWNSAAFSNISTVSAGLLNIFSSSGTATQVEAVAHGLGAIPNNTQAFLLCANSGGDIGYAQGDKVQLSNLKSNTTSENPIMGVAVDVTNVTFLYNQNAGVGTGFRIPHKATGALTQITYANWSFGATASV